MRENVNTYTATMEDNDDVDITNPRVEEMQYFENLFESEADNVWMNHTAPTAEVENPEKVARLFFNDIP